MNKVIIMGRLTRDPEVRYAQTGADGNTMAIARFSLAVDRRFKKDGEQQADFLNCVAFGKQGEFVEKYLAKGTKIVVEGRIQTGSYTDKETGKKVYTTDIVCESLEFAESKTQNSTSQEQPSNVGDGFMTVPDNLEDEGLPFM
jgi:single-strand DNA-binding protein